MRTITENQRVTLGRINRMFLKQPYFFLEPYLKILSFWGDEETIIIHDECFTEEFKTKIKNDPDEYLLFFRNFLVKEFNLKDSSLEGCTLVFNTQLVPEKDVFI